MRARGGGFFHQGAYGWCLQAVETAPTTTGVLIPAPAAQVQASGPAGGREGMGRPSRGAPGWGEPGGQGGDGEPSPGKAGPGAAWRGEDVGSLVPPTAGQHRSWTGRKGRAVRKSPGDGEAAQGFSARRRPAGCTSLFSAHSAGRLGGINPGVQHTVESTWQGVSPAHLEGEERH